jgi:hypothetical protein
MKYVIPKGTKIVRSVTIDAGLNAHWEHITSTVEVVYTESERLSGKRQITLASAYYEFKLPPNEGKYYRVAVVQERVRVFE